MVALVGEPGAGLFNDAIVDAHVDEGGFPGNALTVHDVKFGDLERRRHLVFHDLEFGAVTNGILAILQGLGAPHIAPHRGIEFQGLTTGRGFGGTKHDADFLAQLVDENGGGAGVVQGTGHFPKRLAHEASLQAHVAIPHVAFYFGLRGEGGHGVNDDEVDGAGADQHVGDL